MKEVKILTQSISVLKTTKEQMEEFEKEIEKKLNEGFEIKSSNTLSKGNYYYIYVILERVV